MLTAPQITDPAPNIALDPQGIRGTQSARRLRLGRRRRQWQTGFAVSLLILCIAALSWFGLQPRESGFAVQSARTLPLDWSAPATLGDRDKLYLTSASGALWQIGSDGTIRDFIHASRAGAPPLIESDGVYVPGRDGRLWVFDGDGKTRWNRDLSAALATTPALWRAGQLQILGVGDSDGLILSLNPNDGKTLWKKYLGGPIGNALTPTRDGFVAPTLASGVWRGGLVCLDARDGTIRWRFTSKASAAGVAMPLFDGTNNLVYWNNDEGQITCLDASNGRVVWEYDLGAQSDLSVILRVKPVLTGESLLVGGNDGLLRSLQTRDGKPRWIRSVDAPIRALHAATAGERPAILVVTQREIILVDAAKGAILGRDKGTMAWPANNGKSAIIVGDNGSWRRVNW